MSLTKTLKVAIVGDTKGARDEMDKLGGSAGKVGGKLSTAFSGAGSVLGNLGVPLGVFGGALDKLGEHLDETDKKAKGFGGNLAAIGKAATMGLAGGFAAAAYESIKLGASFQSSMETIHTQAGASQAEVNKMSSAILGLAGPTATAPEQLATALYHVESTGIHGAKALDEVRVAAEGAKVGHADLEAVTNALNAAIASGIPGVKNTTQAMGALNAIVGSGDMKMQDLADAMGTGVVTVVKGFGLSLNDVGAALATFGDNNIRGADAATYLRTTVEAFAAPAKSGQKALASIGITATQLGDDMKKGGLNAAITDLHKHLVAAGDAGANAGELLTTAFGKKAGPGVQVLVGQFDRFESKTKEVNAGAKNFGSDWKATTHTLAFQMDQTKSTVEALGTKFGMALIPKLQMAMRAVMGVVNWFEKHKTAAKALAVVIGGALATAMGAFAINTGVKMVKSVGEAGRSIGKLASTMLERLVPSSTAVSEAFAAESTAAEEAGAASTTAFGPIGLILAGVALAGYELVKHWKTISKDIAGVWHEVLSVAKTVWGDVVKFFTGIPKAILGALKGFGKLLVGWMDDAGHLLERAVKAYFTGLVDLYIKLPLKLIGAVGSFGKKLLHWMDDAWHGLTGYVKTAWSNEVSFWEGIPGKVISAVSSFGKKLLGWITDAWGNVTSGLTSGVNAMQSFVTGIPGKILGWFGDAGKMLFRWGGDLIHGLLNGIKSVAGDIGGAIKGVFDAVPGVSLIKKIPGLSWLAEGGLITQPTLAVVGEAGPELVLPLSKLSSFLAPPTPVPTSINALGSTGAAGAAQASGATASAPPGGMVVTYAPTYDMPIQGGIDQITLQALRQMLALHDDELMATLKAGFAQMHR